MEAGGAAGWAQGSPAWLHRRPRRRRCKSDPGVLSPPFAPRPAQCRVEVESPGGAGPEPQRAPLLGAAAKGSWKWGIWGKRCSGGTGALAGGAEVVPSLAQSPQHLCCC